MSSTGCGIESALMTNTLPEQFLSKCIKVSPDDILSRDPAGCKPAMAFARSRIDHEIMTCNKIFPIDCQSHGTGKSIYVQCKMLEIFFFQRPEACLLVLVPYKIGCAFITMPDISAAMHIGRT